MKRIFFFVTLFSCLTVYISKAQTPFTTGNVVVLRIGDGSVALTDGTYPVFLDEFTVSGALVQSIAMPTSVSGANQRFTLNGFSGSPTAESGALILSPDHQWLTAAGYNFPVLTGGGSLNTSNDRVVALINYNANINTSTKLSDAGTGFPYSAVTSNGTDIWACFASEGLRYATVGSSTSISMVAPAVDLHRIVDISNNQLYVGSRQGRVRIVGTGLPTTGGQTVTSLPGIPTVNGQVQFFFADINPSIPGNDVLYIVHDVSGLQKYSLNGTTWAVNGTIGGDADDYRGITGVVNGTSVTLYCTRKGGTGAAGGGELVTITDASGYGGTFVGTPTVLATASNQTAFRGVAFAPSNPTPQSLSISAKVFLQGDYSSSLGRHKDVTTAWSAALNGSALNQPYTGAPFNYAGTESVSPGFFTSTAANTDIVDWILLELHDATTPSTIVARQAAFIREDGQVVGLDGTSNPSFTGLNAGNYYIVLRHRNHLAVRSATAIAFSGSSATQYDFTTSQAQAYQNSTITTNAALKDLGSGKFGMWGGNVNANANVRYAGAQSDASAILTALSNNQAAILNNVYNSADVNFDGKVKYTGPYNDAIALLSYLSANQDAVITEHQ